MYLYPKPMESEMVMYNNQDSTKRVGFVTAVVVVAMLMLSAGCQVDPTGGHESAFFPGEGAHRSSTKFMQVQASNGAKADRTLRVVHFDGDQLNSLGQEKLNLMVGKDSCQTSATTDGAATTAAAAANKPKFVVYLDVAEATVEARTESVKEYLEGKGLAAAQLKFETGPNPDGFIPAAPQMAKLAEMDEAGEMSNDSSSAESSGMAGGN
jgi:hypothetical protein